jgi:FkbM family methyltransferase
MNVIDVGANVGAYALLAAKRLAPYGRVLAFEAAPQTHRFLVENIRRNGFSNVRAELLALGDVLGLLTFTERSDFGKSSVCINSEVCGTIQVHAIALDTTAQPGAPIDYLMIDVEGYELAVLRGALQEGRPQHLLQRDPGTPDPGIEITELSWKPRDQRS